MKKTRSKKSRDTVPLSFFLITMLHLSIPLYCILHKDIEAVFSYLFSICLPFKENFTVYKKINPYGGRTCFDNDKIYQLLII